MAKKYTSIYCDGGYYEKLRLVKWAYIITDEESIEKSDIGKLPSGSGFEVEEAESEAILQALSFCNAYEGNYRIYTDSRSVLDKIENKVPNATKNPRISAIQNLVKQINESPKPQSVVIKFIKRRSSKFAQLVDDYCFKDYYEQINKA